jgi:hypothetical protein
MTDTKAIMIGGLILGAACALLVAALMYNMPGTLRDTAKQALKVCEQDLPRSKHCIITAIPQE